MMISGVNIAQAREELFQLSQQQAAQMGGSGGMGIQ